MIKSIFRFFILVNLSLTLISVSSCQNEEIIFHDDSLYLGATVVNPFNVSTRAEVTATIIKSADFNTPFYVEMISDGETRYGKYEVMSGNEGRLSSASGSEPLNWLSPEANHIFYSWTMPWVDDDEYQPGVSSASTTISFDQNATMYANVKGQEKNNCRFLEKFIGTKAGPVNYRNNGEYVELQYDHLVSKIRIGSVILIKGDGTTNNSVSGEITFLGMPETATFNRRPEDGGAPKVKGYSETDDPMKVTYNFGSNQSSTFYVCPETDFSKLEFQVHLDNEEYNKEGDYYGNFSNVNFLRDIYTNWDEDKLETVLYAGEMMNLNLTLTQGHGVGVTMTIHGWDVSSPKSGSSYSHPGIYTAGQAKDVSNLFAGNYTEKEADEIFGMYGDTMDEEKVFPIYEDLNMGQFSFSMDKDYIIDGMGHTITMTPRTSDNQKIVRIGPCRDIYLTDGVNTVYIDPNGYIFIVNADGDLILPGVQLPELKDNEYTYDIDLKTGTVATSRQKS